MEIEVLLKQAIAYEKKGLEKEALDIYRQISKIEMGGCVKYDINYQTGLLLLGMCEDDFLPFYYQEAIAHLIKAYQQDFQAEEILQLLNEMIYSPNAEAMEQQYAENRLYLQQKYKIDLNLYHDLPIQVFPVHENMSRIFLLAEHRFLAENEMILEYRAYEMMMLYSLEKEFLADDIALLIKPFGVRKSEAFYAQCVKQSSCGNFPENISKNKDLYTEDMFCWMMAIYFWHRGNREKAELYVRKGLKHLPLHMGLNFLLAAIYENKCDYIGAAKLYGGLSLIGNEHYLAKINSKIKECMDASNKISRECFLAFSNALCYAQVEEKYGNLKKRCYVDKDGRIEVKFYTLLGEFIKSGKNERYFIGAYNDNIKGLSDRVIAVVDGLNAVNRAWYAYMSNQYVLMKARIKREACYEKIDRPFVIPIAVTKIAQKINFVYGDGKVSTIELGAYEFSYFRIDKKVKIISDDDLVFGSEIILEHSPKRKKLILDIFVDTFSFGYIKKGHYDLIPNIMKFFNKGVIFCNNYTVAEYTYPAVPAIETGCYVFKNKIFHTKAYAELPAKLKTMSRCAKEQGYYCTSAMGTYVGVANGAYDAFDEMTTSNVYNLHSSMAVEQLITQMEGFSEVDQYNRIHMLDIHSVFSKNVPNLRQQVKYSFDARIESADPFKSPFKDISKSAFNISQFEDDFRSMDRNLGVLFDYIEKNYADEEIFISLYGDHGITTEPYLLCEDRGCAALMVRGANVPAVGLVESEITSLVDLYAIKAHCCNYEIDERNIDGRLPKIFGGEGHEYVIMNSLYENQTFKICIRTMQYEFRLETKDLTRPDGTIDLEHFTYQLYERDKLYEPIHDSKLFNYFLRIVDKYTKSIQRSNCLDGMVREELFSSI